MRQQAVIIIIIAACSTTNDFMFDSPAAHALLATVSELCVTTVAARTAPGHT